MAKVTMVYPKKHFAEAICNERPKIFDVIRETIKDMQVE